MPCEETIRTRRIIGMNIYDTILLGNGLTISILQNIQKTCKEELNKEERLICNQNEFIAYLLSCPIDCSLYKGLLHICTFDSFSSCEIEKIRSAHEKAKKEFFQYDELTGQSHIDYIRQNGFEAWGGVHCFDNESSLYKRNKELVYSINNYWFYLLRKDILSKAGAKNVVNKTARVISSFSNRLTLNFDTIIDDYCSVEHLHGSFINNFKRWGDLLFFEYGINSFEYPYLFGTNAFEKQVRINRIRKKKKEGDYYNFDFFFNENRYYGNVLIYGVGFSESSIKQYSSLPFFVLEKSASYYNCLDGHIIKRLVMLQKTGRVNRITIVSHC